MRELKLDVDSLYYLLKSAWLVPSSRRSSPQRGDIVIEFSRFQQDTTMIGHYERYDAEEQKHYVVSLTGERQTWWNAEPIVVKMAEPQPTGEEK